MRRKERDRDSKRKRKKEKEGESHASKGFMGGGSLFWARQNWRNRPLKTFTLQRELTGAATLQKELTCQNPFPRSDVERELNIPLGKVGRNTVTDGDPVTVTGNGADSLLPLPGGATLCVPDHR